MKNHQKSNNTQQKKFIFISVHVRNLIVVNLRHQDPEIILCEEFALLRFLDFAPISLTALDSLKSILIL